jgi:hypothetical protein
MNIDNKLSQLKRMADKGDPRTQQALIHLKSRLGHYKCSVCDRAYNGPENDQNRCDKHYWDISIDEDDFIEPNNSSGMNFYLIIDPEDRIISTHSNYGSGIPMTVYNGIETLVSVQNNASGSSVEEILLDNIEKLDSLADLYEGAEWNGGNDRGIWSDYEEKYHLEENLQSEISETKQYYADVGDWFAPGGFGYFDILNFENMELALDSESGDQGEAILDRDQVEVYFTELLNERLEEIEDEISNTDAFSSAALAELTEERERINNFLA